MMRPEFTTGQRVYDRTGQPARYDKPEGAAHRVMPLITLGGFDDEDEFEGAPELWEQVFEAPPVPSKWWWVIGVVILVVLGVVAVNSYLDVGDGPKTYQQEK